MHTLKKKIELSSKTDSENGSFCFDIPNCRSNYDISSFMTINFDVAQKEPVQVLQEAVEAVLTEEVAAKVVKDMGYAIFGDPQL